MSVSKRSRVCHVKQQKRLQRADALHREALDLVERSKRTVRRCVLLVQLSAAALAAQGCTAVCTCTNKFEAACAEARGQVLHVGEQHMCVGADGMVIATWIEDGGAS